MFYFINAKKSSQKQHGWSNLCRVGHWENKGVVLPNLSLNRSFWMIC